MALPLIFFASRACSHKEPDRNEPKFSKRTTVLCGFAVWLEMCAEIVTPLVLGILGATQIMAMSPAAAYSLIGLGVVTTLLWIAFMTQACCSRKTPSKGLS